MLPQLRHPTNYYLAHSIDISQPDFVSVKVNEDKDTVFYDNKKDYSKITNKRSISPQEQNEQKQMVYHTMKAPQVIRRNMETSKENPFSGGVQFSQKINPSDKSNYAIG